MARGLGEVQRAVLEMVEAHPEGLTAAAIAERRYGRRATRAQVEAVRRAIRTLDAAGLINRTTRWDNRPRKSLKRFVALAPCEGLYCDSCAQRKRRVRLQDWHRKSMRANAEHDPGWLDDLAVAEQTGFVHATASDRIVSERPNAVDQCHRRLQFIAPSRGTS